MTKNWTFCLFGAKVAKKNCTSKAHILHTSKSVCNGHAKQYWCETSENLLRKWPKTLIFTYFVAQNSPQIGPLRPIFHTPLKVLAMSMWSNTTVKPMKTFWDHDQSPEFWLILESKMAQKLDLWGPNYTHLWKYLQWAYKAILMCIQRILLNKIVENLNIDSFGAPKWPKHFYTPTKIAPASL